MTDGIIQKVFNDRLEALNRYPNLKWDSVKVTHLVKFIEQEVITEIKKQRNTWMGNMSIMEIELFTKELIGDNQE